MSKVQLNQTNDCEIPEDWELRELGSLGQVITGKTPPTRDADNFGAGYPFITPIDMVGQKYVRTTERCVTEKGKDSVRTCLLPAESVCVSCIGSDMGKVIMTDRPSITNQQLNSIVCEQAEPQYVYYGVMNIKNKLRNEAFHSTAVPILNKSAFSRFAIQIPIAKSKQCAIAKILSDLDDKIELNYQMNKTLESMGQVLFIKWFSEESDSWRNGVVEDVAKLSREAINPSDFSSEIFDHYSIPAFDEGRLPKKEVGENIQSNKFIVPSNAILLSKLNPRIPRIWFPNVRLNCRSVCSTEFLVVIPQPGISAEYLYGLFSSQTFIDSFTSLVTGTSGSHQRVKPDDLLAIKLTIPPSDNIARFSMLVKPLYQCMAQNIEESSILAMIRDFLLPRLMSGRLKISE